MSPETDTRQRIVNAARSLISSRSYADVGIAAICESAQVQKGSFYHFFPSKQALTLELVDNYFIDFKDNIIDVAMAAGDSPMGRITRLCELLYSVQKHMFDSSGHMPGCPLGNLAVELSTQDEPIRQKVDDKFCRTEQALAGALREAIEIGEIELLDVEATAQAMFAYLEGSMLLAKSRNDPELLKQLAPAIVQIRIPLA